MEAIFQKLIANNFSDLTGLTANASIPVSQTLLNEIIAVTLRGNRTIDSFEVSIQEQNRIAVQLKTTLLPWALNLRLKLDRFVDLESFSSPKLRAWLENNQLLGRLGSLFNALPEWVKLYGNQVVIDLGYFLRSPAEKRLFHLIKSVKISTEEGKAIFEIKVDVA